MSGKLYMVDDNPDHHFLVYKALKQLNLTARLFSKMAAPIQPSGHLAWITGPFNWSLPLQLGLHKKPVAILNIDRFYDDLLSLIRRMVEKGFLKEINQKMLLVSDDINDLLNQMENYEAPTVDKWVTKSSAMY